MQNVTIRLRRRTPRVTLVMDVRLRIILMPMHAALALWGRTVCPQVVLLSPSCPSGKVFIVELRLLPMSAAAPTLMLAVRTLMKEASALLVHRGAWEVVLGPTTQTISNTRTAALQVTLYAHRDWRESFAGNAMRQTSSTYAPTITDEHIVSSAPRCYHET